MATINLGRVGYVHKGAYSHAATYEKYDVVLYNHGSYLYIGESGSGHAPTDKAYWQAMLDPAEMNAATNTARAAADNIYQRLASFTAPFSVTGNPVSCYPVADYPLDAIIHLVPVQAGEGNPAPDNVRAISPVRQFAVRNGEQEIPVHLVNPVYGGDYHWKALKITGKAKYRELTGNEGWYLNQNGSTSYFVLHLEQSEIGVDHKAYMSHYSHLDTMAFGVPGTNVFRCWNTKGVFRVGIRPDLSAYNVYDHDGSVAKWKEYLSAQAAAGTPVQIVYFVQNGEEEAVSSFGDIISYRGENIISTDNGTITVSGPLDPAYQNAQQDERIEALEEGAVSGGGSYTLPVASAETLGGVKVGSGLQMNGEALGVKNTKYILLNTIITAEEVEEVLINIDSNGNPFILTECYIEVEYNGETNGSLTSLAGNGSNIASYNHFDYTNYNKFSALKAYQNGGYWDMMAYKPNFQYGAREILGAAEDTFFKNSIEAIPNINVICVYANKGGNTTVIPIGTVVKLWGVRADA